MMVRWWAAFFIAGLVGPQGPIAGLGASLSAAAAATWVLARRAALDERRFDGAARRRLGTAAASCTMICATAIIVWQAAGLQLDAHDCTWTRARLEAKNALGAAGVSAAGSRAQARVQTATGIRRLALAGARMWLIERLEAGRLSKRSRALIGALILDDRRSLDFALSESYSYVGITHFLALSGMHLGAIAIPLSKILSRLIRSKRAADVALFAILCLYSAVAGFPASLVRALFLCAAVIAYRLLGLHTDLLGALMAGSFVLVSIDPSIAFDAGFRLSFAAVCGIALIGIPVSRMIEALLPGGFRGKAIKAVLFPAVITCSVQFLTMPLTIALFKRSSLLSPLVNVIVSFPFTILLYAGVLYVFVPLAPMRAVVGPPINLLCRFLASVPAAFSRRPHEALLQRDFNTIIYLGGVALVAIALRKSCARKGRLLCTGLAFIAIAFAVPECARRVVAGSHGDGSENAVAVDPISFAGGVYVSEGGGVVFIGEGFSSGESYRLVRVLWAAGVRKIECCVVKPSKLRKNHGLFYLLKRMQVNEMVCSPYLLEGSGGTMRHLQENGVKLRPMCRGDSIVGKCWRLDIGGPVYPPPVGVSIARDDADLRWRFVSRVGAGITQLDLERACGYHAEP